jgi:hypothetical protein
MTSDHGYWSADGAVIRNVSAQVRSSDLPADVEPTLGAHIVARRSAYDHHGIYVGNGRVVHYAGLCRSLQRAPVEETTVECFALGQEITVRSNPIAKYAGSEAVLRARSRLGENRYRLLTNNCEHFCNWCVSGISHSAQVQQRLRLPLRALTALFHA